MPNIYGVLPVLEALRASSRRIERIVVAEGARNQRLHQIIERASQAGIAVRREPRAALDRLVGGANHQGVVAIAAAIEYADQDELLSQITPQTVFVLLDGIEDPHNLGAIIRTAECAGASAVVIPERRCAHVTEAVAKASAGAIEYLPIVRVTNLARFIDELKQRWCRVIGVEASARVSYTDQDYSGAIALVFGSEGRGLHRLVAERCDALVSIPMRGHIGSLNVSVAAGVVLFEAMRQRASR
jgi:23S rRNA (guanosine2251-2'-O)-methyltransferase